MNILTRTGSRPEYFKTLDESICNQTYKNIRHIKSNDNPECSYLDGVNDVFVTKKNRNLGKGFYNLYLNTLGDKVNKGWVIILDDDSKLVDDEFINLLAQECEISSINDILIYQSYITPRKIKIPQQEYMVPGSIVKNHVDMACFCFHHSVFDHVQFGSQIYGDYRFLDKIKKSKKFKFKFLTDLKIGIWANYDGCKLGR